MAFHQINGLRIRTSFEYPPIPVRSFDWNAVDDDTYDCDCDQDGFFSSTCPIGHGATEQEAIDDLLEQVEENNDGRIEACISCGGDGGGEVWTGYDPRDGAATGHWQKCRACDGTGDEVIQLKPVTLRDLELMETDHVA